MSDDDLTVSVLEDEVTTKHESSFKVVVFDQAGVVHTQLSMLVTTFRGLPATIN